MNIFWKPDCTRIGRYSGGEAEYDHTTTYPIVQFFSNPTYDLKSRLNQYHTDQNGYYYTLVPENAQSVSARINQFPGDSVTILDVGCSAGANLLLMEDLFQKATQKRVIIKGYDIDTELLTRVKAGQEVYHSHRALLHPVVEEIVQKYFTLKEIITANPRKIGSINGSGDQFLYTLNSEALVRLSSLVEESNALDLPIPDNSSHLTICTFVLRYQTEIDSWRIFRELIRVTTPGGVIFTEENAFQKVGSGVRHLNPRLEPAISFYDQRKALYYKHIEEERYSKEGIEAVGDIAEIDQIIDRMAKKINLF